MSKERKEAEKASSQLSEHIQDRSYITSIGIGKHEGEFVIIVYIKNEKDVQKAKEIEAIRSGWMGHSVVLKILGDPEPLFVIAISDSSSMFEHLLTPPVVESDNGFELESRDDKVSFEYMLAVSASSLFILMPFLYLLYKIVYQRIVVISIPLMAAIFTGVMGLLLAVDSKKLLNRDKYDNN